MKIPLYFLFLFIACGNLSAEGSQYAALPDDSLQPDTSGLKSITSHPGTFLTPLPSAVKENSGIIFYRDMIWTHNDSGGKPELYAIDTATGEIVQIIVLAGAKNVDWEDITQDRQFIYIGDVGNNRGNRKDLKIYKVPKQDVPRDRDVEIENYEVISYSYGNQKSFDKRMHRHDFDCESLIAAGDSLFLFTKNWADQQTRVYALPKKGGDYTVFPHEVFDAGGLITGAGISPDGSQLALIGYIDFESFMWLFWDIEGLGFFSGNHLRVNFPDLVFVQTEGICFVSEKELLISCEESSEFPSLFLANTDSLRMMAEARLGNYYSGHIVLAGMPPEVSRRLRVDIMELPEPAFRFELRNRRWDKLFEGSDVKQENDKKIRITIKTKDLENGLYFLRIESGEYTLIRKVRVKN